MKTLRSACLVTQALREALAAEADQRVGETAVAVRSAERRAGDDFVRARREACRNAAAKRDAIAKRARLCAAHLWDYRE